MNLTNEFRLKVLEALQEQRKNFGGSNAAFAKQWSINAAVYSQLSNGKLEGLLKDSQWLHIGRELGVSLRERKWKIARTEVFTTIEEDIDFCQRYAKSKIYVDDCGIGKTFTAKYLARTRKNVFYIDASQAKGKQAFIRLFARTIGVDVGRFVDMKANIKYYLQMLEQPLVIIDEAGDLEYTAFLELKEFWNATENVCGWYLMGADGLKEKMRRGIDAKKVGYRELFSRFSESYSSSVPSGTQDKLAFYMKLLNDVLKVNMNDDKKREALVKKCLGTNENGDIGGLRKAESLLIIINDASNVDD